MPGGGWHASLRSPGIGPPCVVLGSGYTKELPAKAVGQLSTKRVSKGTLISSKPTPDSSSLRTPPKQKVADLKDELNKRLIETLQEQVRVLEQEKALRMTAERTPPPPPGRSRTPPMYTPRTRMKNKRRHSQAVIKTPLAIEGSQTSTALIKEHGSLRAAYSNLSSRSASNSMATSLPLDSYSTFMKAAQSTEVTSPTASLKQKLSDLQQQSHRLEQVLLSRQESHRQHLSLLTAEIQREEYERARLSSVLGSF
eukprot:TRINITY_DN1362_c2_g1_i2.p1 TRINITY_DN1362_c2_g1~~TRINITY_DN1362_c2_g1_i2.p1  ORF type:complete len:254 (+),score=42.35 TRINITY_DN1362_c2_g1_i2:143-904(+)